MSNPNNEIVNTALETVAAQNSSIVNSITPGTNVENLNIFFGTGVLSNGEISFGLNPSFLTMALLAKSVQQEIEKQGKESHIFALVADAQAREAIEPDDGQERLIEEITAFNVTVMTALFAALNASNVQVFPSSTQPDLAKSYSEIESGKLFAALSDRQVGIKVGWSSKRVSINGGDPIRDAKYFDEQSEINNPDSRGKLAYIYGPEGISLDKTLNPSQMANVPPYISDAAEVSLGNAINLEEVFADVERRISKPASKQLKNYFTAVGRATRSIFTIEDLGNLQAVQALIDASRVK